ncbi:hypothetical protein L1987_54769 [Smallanthus sonchifolius]|uniref:Uncharacterized protein n=1 Tax=Smallanthus sonchifolius TaxID=185202 RepID=A0ACB9E940_9ASTR|nr:hypothetical protein L1987_54769 [Smallanthus sonchifolius]
MQRWILSNGMNRRLKNQTEEDSGEVDIKKLIKENNILNAESEKTPVGSRIGVSNVQSPLTITVEEKVESDMGNKQREQRNRKLPERFCSPYVDREVSLTEDNRIGEILPTICFLHMRTHGTSFSNVRGL